MVPLSFSSYQFFAVGEATLFWPAQKALLVADLHLEKASFYALQGQMLPPYDSQATLENLQKAIAETGAQRVFCLGDNYHDRHGEIRLEPTAATILTQMTQHIDWVWITGNHDPDVSGLWGGRAVAQWHAEGLALRHEGSINPEKPEISGHYHPKHRVAVRGRHIRRRCYVRGRNHLIMPAFGTLTGGMAADDDVILDLLGHPAEALLPAGGKLLRFALTTGPRASPQAETQGQLPLKATPHQSTGHRQ